MDKIATEIASMLLDIDAIQIRPNEPFTWASGWKSPIYCDNRLSLSHPEVRTYIKDRIIEKIQKDFPQIEAVAGVATAGIPQAALIADSLNIPLLYIRSKSKVHGMTNLIEGKVAPNTKVVVIEDLVSTGGSSMRASLALREAGYDVLGLISVFTYGFRVAEDSFKNARIPFFALSDYNSLLALASDTGKVSENEIQLLKEWQESPSTWKEEF